MIIFDLKIYGNVSMLYFHDIKLKEKTLFQFSEQYNDFKFLIQFIKAKRDLDYIVGYNMEKYGNYILNYLLSNSDKLINDNGLMISYKLHMLSEGLKSQVFPMELKYLDLFRSIDLIKYMNFNERIYFHNIRLEFGEDSFLDIDNEDFVPVRMFNDIIEYLKSNIRVITKLYEMYKEDIALRHDISRSIGLNIMNKFYYGIGNNLILSHYRNKLGASIKDIVNLKLEEDKTYSYKVSQILKKDFSYTLEDSKLFYKSLSNLILDDSFNPKMNFNINHWAFKIQKYIKREYEEGVYSGSYLAIDISLLPIYSMIDNNIFPSFLDNDFISETCKYYNYYLKAKEKGNQRLEKAMHNILYYLVENMDVPSSFTESKLTQNTIYIHNILYLLQIIDILIYNNIEIIFCNRDILMINMNGYEIDNIKQMLSNTIHTDLYAYKVSKFAYKDSSNFILIKEGYLNDIGNFKNYIVEYGIFNYDQLFSFKSPKVIMKAFIKSLITGEKGDELINKHDEIKDFMITMPNPKSFTLTNEKKTNIFYFYGKKDLIKIDTKEVVGKYDTALESRIEYLKKYSCVNNLKNTQKKLF